MPDSNMLFDGDILQVLHFADLWHKASSLAQKPDSLSLAESISSLCTASGKSSLLPAFGDAALGLDCMLKVLSGLFFGIS